MSSVILSIFYILTFIISFAGFLLFKISNKERNFILDLPLRFVAYLCLISFIVGGVNLLRIPINLLSLGIINILIALSMFYYIYKNKGRQKYFFSKFDAIAFVIIVGIIAFIAINRFGIRLNINYETSDPGTHFKSAMNIFNSQRVEGIYFNALANSILINILAPFTFVLKYYKIYILADILMYCLSAVMFYTFIRNSPQKNTKLLKVSSLAITIIYMLAYPLSNILFGFGHLGVSVTVIIFIFYMSNEYVNGQISKRISRMVLMLACYSLVICYSLFAPFIFIVVCAFIGFHYLKNKKLFSREFVVVNFKIFLIPVLLGVYYAYFSYFDGDLTAATAITSEGYIFRDLFASFVIFLPFSIYFVCKEIKERKNSIVPLAFIFIVFCMTVLLTLGLKGKLSSYYLFKFHYVLWAICMYLFGNGVMNLFDKNKEVVISYLLVWTTLAAFGFSGVENKITERNNLFNPTPKALAYMEIFSFNNDLLKKHPDNSARFDLYNQVYILQNESTEKTFISDNWLETFWFEAISNQRLDSYYYWVNNAKTIKYVKEQCDYIVIINDSEFYNNNKTYFDSLESVYHNELGWIAEIK